MGLSRRWGICFRLWRGRDHHVLALSSSHWSEKRGQRASEVRLGLFAVSNFLPPPVQRSHYALTDNKGQFASPIFVRHKPGDGLCLNMKRVSSLNLIRSLRNHGSGEAWLKFSRAATSERNQGKRGVLGNVHVRPSAVGLIKRHFNLLLLKNKRKKMRKILRKHIKIHLCSVSVRSEPCLLLKVTF